MSACTVTTATSVGDQNPDGMVLGWNTTDKISFFGATPVLRQTAATAVDATTTTYSSTMGTAINAIITALTNLGLVA
jgi:hypothetical protein